MGPIADLRQLLNDSQGQSPTRCRHEQCHKETNGGKAYCTGHVLRQDYAASVHADVLATSRELSRVGRLEAAGKDGMDAVDVSGLVCREILAMIEDEPMTANRIGRAISGFYEDATRTSPRVVAAYVRALKAAGLVRTRPATRRANVMWVEVCGE